MQQRRTNTNGKGQLEGIGHTVGSGYRRAIHAVIVRRDQLGVATQTVSQAQCGTNGQHVVLTHRALILHTKVELIALDGGAVCLVQRIHIAVAVGNRDRLVVLTPEIRDVGTHAEALQHFPSKADESLAEATATVKHIVVIAGTRARSTEVHIVIGCRIVVVADVRIRHDTKAKAYLR